MSCIRILIAFLNKRLRKSITNVINNETVRLPSHFKYMWRHIVTLDSIRSKLYQLELLKVTKKPPDNICHIQFSDKELN